MANFILSVVCTVVLLQLVQSYRDFQSNIPNGVKVPNPCSPTEFWEGVGHLVKGGGGPRNPFGVLFKEQGYTWTKTVCNADSDMDGRTNGEELGDPNCDWKKGETPEYSTGLSHPGICEPYDSEDCKDVNSFLDCSEFKCDSIDEDTFSYDVRLTTSSVPAEKTTYICQVLDLPSDGDYHLVATTPFIDNKNVMHHAIVYGCSDSANIEPRHLSASQCFMSRIDGCDDIIAIWAIGGTGVCYHKNAGFRVGKNGYKRAVLELHWNNLMETEGYTDGSGITLHLTPNLKPYDAGMMLIGQMLLGIPPRTPHHTENSTCSSECTKRKMTGNINVVGALNHMHYLGSSVTSQMVSEDGDVTILSHEKDFSFDSPKFVSFEEPLIMDPGYKLQLACHYDSTGRDSTTFYGEGAFEEMCFAFIMYYPKENFNGSCVSRGTYDECGVSTMGKDDCDLEALGNNSDPVNAARNARLYGNCIPGICQEGCLDVVREIFKEPCFQEKYQKDIKASMGYGDDATKLAIMDYFYRMDSCNAELAKEQCGSTWPTTPTTASAVSTNMASSAFIVFFAVVISYM
ncbi:MOXD1 homolog 2-like [Mercenaria mercenaria]|uniref:MOXD1 homolog 2-like n=1 Tax=Mercenaria mercenaria TaxID=6596 RepID=UPI00234FAB12|nr:MOXD1 homolog 2-like [Mercenaria mercenaria]